MPDYKKIKWEVREEEAKYYANQTSDGVETFEFFLNYCQTQLPTEDLKKSYLLFLTEKNRLHLEVNHSFDTFSKQPFLSAFLVWIKESALDASKRLEAKLLLENGFIGVLDKDGRKWTLANATKFDHSIVLESIRCHKNLTFSLREKLVKTYLDFMNWLSTSTYGYISKLEDPDQIRCKERSLAYSNFVNFLSHLKDEDQVVAKLLYFGGSRTLEEVLTLNVESIDFEKRFINFGLKPIPYPLHVFADIKELLKERNQGRIFIGRRGKGTDLNPATIFRNFKEAAFEVGLGKNFTPKYLTINK